MKIKINGKFYNHFNNLNIKFNLDSFASVFTFFAYFNKENKEIFKPLSYPTVEIFKDNELLLTGNLVSYSFSSSAEPQLVKVSGYSKAGILEDVSIPFSFYPLEKNNKSLVEIANELLRAFKINLINSTNAANLVYEKTITDPSSTPASYISKLASQRNIIISHNKKGDIVFKEININSKPKKIAAVTSSSFKADGRKFHSEVNVIRQPSDDNANSETFDKQSGLISNFRPITKKMSSGEDAETDKAASNLLAKELKSLQLTLNFSEIDYSLNNGDIINYKNEDLFIFRETKFIISSITYNEKKGSETMSLTCLLPESFTGKTPKNLFV